MAMIIHGKVEGFCVGRRFGWFLTEWAEARRIDPVGDIPPESEVGDTASDRSEAQ